MRGCLHEGGLLVASVISRAEDNPVVGAAGAGEGARLIVLGIAVGVGAVSLEEPGVVGRAAAAGVATVLVRLEHGAGVVAAARRLQRPGALPVDVRRAPDAAAAA